jgi:hypothetical protein
MGRSRSSVSESPVNNGRPSRRASSRGAAVPALLDSPAAGRRSSRGRTSGSGDVMASPQRRSQRGAAAAGSSSREGVIHLEDDDEEEEEEEDDEETQELDIKGSQLQV